MKHGRCCPLCQCLIDWLIDCYSPVYYPIGAFPARQAVIIIKILFRLVWKSRGEKNYPHRRVHGPNPIRCRNNSTRIVKWPRSFIEHTNWASDVNLQRVNRSLRINRTNLAGVDRATDGWSQVVGPPTEGGVHNSFIVSLLYIKETLASGATDRDCADQLNAKRSSGQAVSSVVTQRVLGV